MKKITNPCVNEDLYMFDFTDKTFYKLCILENRIDSEQGAMLLRCRHYDGIEDDLVIRPEDITDYGEQGDAAWVTGGAFNHLVLISHSKENLNTMLHNKFNDIMDMLRVFLM